LDAFIHTLPWVARDAAPKHDLACLLNSAFISDAGGLGHLDAIVEKVDILTNLGHLYNLFNSTNNLGKFDAYSVSFTKHALVTVMPGGMGFCTVMHVTLGSISSNSIASDAGSSGLGRMTRE
jgi:hypothetical protein